MHRRSHICIGVYTINNSVFDVMMVLVFGAIGYAMRVIAFPAAPLLLGFVLGPMMEEHFRRAMLISGGNFMTFIERPISLSFMLATVALLAWSTWSASRPARRAMLV
ncbi:tripartite tricarboxylate transporter permease [Devosia sp. A369]